MAYNFRLVVLILICKNCIALEFSNNFEVSNKIFENRHLASGEKYTNDLYYSSDISHEIYKHKVKSFLRMNAEYLELEEEPYRFRVDEWYLSYRFESSWNLKIGSFKSFWGVAESVNVVDILNQRDFSYDFGGNYKISQPMINLAFDNGLMIWENTLIIDPQARIYPDKYNRPSLPLRIDNDSYAPSSKKIEFASRLKFLGENYETAFSVFSGYNRDPEFELNYDIDELNQLLNANTLNSNHNFYLIPEYNEIIQIGSEVLYFYNDLLLKSEIAIKEVDNDQWNESVIGGESSIYSVFDSNSDITLYVEYLYSDYMADIAPLLNNDLFIGFRLNFNSTSSSVLESGVYYDLAIGEYLFSTKYESRISNNIKFLLSGNYFKSNEIYSEKDLIRSLINNNIINNPLSLYSRDSFVQTSLIFYW